MRDNIIIVAEMKPKGSIDNAVASLVFELEGLDDSTNDSLHLIILFAVLLVNQRKLQRQY